MPMPKIEAFFNSLYNLCISSRDLRVRSSCDLEILPIALLTREM